MSALRVARESVKPFFTPKGLADYLGVSERTVRGWAADGTVPSYRIGGARRFSAEDVERFVARCRDEKR